MEESALLERLYSKEKELKLDSITIKGVPLWRIVRYYSRLHYLSIHAGYVATSSNQKVVGPRRIKLFSGYWKYLSQKELNVLFTFNRLVMYKGQYFDKLLDPVVEESFLKNANYLIADSPYYTGNYSRMHKDHTVSNERRTLSMQILLHSFKILSPLICKKSVSLVFNMAKEAFELPDSFIKKYYESVAVFLAEYYYYLFWFRLLKPRRVLLVFRAGYFGQIAACKQLSIPVAEFQHGITLDRTVSYTGDYDCRIDPDYFLTFGSYWKSDSFGMTDERTICVGWAYSQLMSRILENCMKIDGTVLAISSPEISDMLLDAISQLSHWNPHIKIHIRLHPSERYNDSQNEKLNTIPNAEVVDNSNDSAAVLPLYNYVVGENSSVLYEALSLGCRVGLLNICGLRPPLEKPGIINSFYVINNPSDFDRFIEEDFTNIQEKESFYSTFQANKFQDFMIKCM